MTKFAIVCENQSWYKLNYPNRRACDFGATITIPIIVGATGAINIFRDQIHNCLWKLI
jgi:hypothetical protein